jgi:hypothetical protein
MGAKWSPNGGKMVLKIVSKFNVTFEGHLGWQKHEKGGHKEPKRSRNGAKMEANPLPRGVGSGTYDF